MAQRHRLLRLIVVIVDPVRQGWEITRSSSRFRENASVAYGSRKLLVRRHADDGNLDAAGS